MNPKPKIAFLSTARYRRPLNPTDEKKFRLLDGVAESFVVGFGERLRVERFDQHAHFFLVPPAPLAVLRYGEFSLAALLVGLWLVWRHDIRVLIAQGPHQAVATALVKRVAGWFGRKVVLVVESHGDFERDLFLQRRVRLASVQRWVMRRGARFATRHADLLRSISNSTGQQLRRWAPGKAMFQFAAWTDADLFAGAGARRNGSTPTEVLYAGVLIPRKGVHHLIRAFGRIAGEFPSARLTLIGADENPPYAAELRRLVEQAGLLERVEFVPALPQRELAERMGRAGMFVLPSSSEGLGRVVFEAMTAGLPVIGSRVGGIPDMITDGVTGLLVDPGDERGLAEALRRLLAKPAEAGRIGRRARQFAVDRFSTERYLEGYTELIQAAWRMAGAEASLDETAAL